MRNSMKMGVFFLAAMLVAGAAFAEIVRLDEQREMIIKTNSTSEAEEQSPFLSAISEEPVGARMEVLSQAQSVIIFFVTMFAVLGLGAGTLAHIALSGEEGENEEKPRRVNEKKSAEILQKMEQRVKERTGLGEKG